jgi:uncharacterized protein YhhL (DUF1145 family)
MLSLATSVILLMRQPECIVLRGRLALRAHMLPQSKKLSRSMKP